MQLWTQCCFIIIVTILSSCSSKNKYPGQTQIQAEFAAKTSELEAQCHDKTPKTCTHYIKNYSALYGPGLALNLVRPKCVEGNKLYCYAEAYIMYFSGDVDEARKKHVSLCENGNFYSCYFLGFNQIMNDSQEGKTQSNQFMTKACQLGDKYGCLVEYKFPNHPLSRNENVTKFNKFMKDFLDARDFESAIYLALYLKESDPDLSLKYLDSFCKQGHQNSCFMSKVYKETGSERQTIAQEYCDKGSSYGCLTQCEIDVNQSIDEDFYKSCHQGCLLGQDRSCYLLSRFVKDARPFDKKIFYYQLGCSYSNPDACYFLAQHLAKIGKKDETKKFLKVACDLGLKESCNSLEKIEIVN